MDCFKRQLKTHCVYKLSIFILVLVLILFVFLFLHFLMSILIYGDTFQLDVSSGSQFGNQTGKWAGIYAPLF